MSYLNSDIKFLAGVGERRAILLMKELNICTLNDLLYYFPFRYIDRTKIYKINEVKEDNQAYIQLRVRIQGFAYQGEARKKRFIAFAADSSGEVELLWFKGVKWIEKRLEVGREYIIFGKPSFFKGRFNMIHPEVELVSTAMSRQNTGGVQGVYSTTETLATSGLGAKGIYALMCTLWGAVSNQIAETLPTYIMQKNGLISLKEALFNIHFPQSAQLLKQAEERLKFEELFGIQLAILSQKVRKTTMNNGFVFPKVGDNFKHFYENQLTFELTQAQKRVVKEIRKDTLSGRQMNRLLQGDVGSGKTLVALMAMLLAVDNGYQAALMAPTEILARQHFATISDFLKGTPCEGRIAILSGATRSKERKGVLERTLSGEVSILIGTHSLLEDRVQFKDLAFVVIDEQHRFGVEQRAKLWAKNELTPHILVMTATPIPRTLAMTLYGDLDVSVIDEMPPNRKPISTYHMYDSQRLRMFGFIRKEIAKGRQIYVVYPLIKESETMDYKCLYDGFESLSREFPLPEYRLSVMHGQMNSEDKNASMKEFKDGITHIMIATSVIEVGVDVPNASVMVIESAERFGLSQLHQLRGRVGRGTEQSYCILMSGEKLSKEARSRLDAMVETNDGFQLSELDLKLRGAGDMHGTQQSGDTFNLRIASLIKDGAIIERARNEAQRILEDDKLLQKPENLLLAELRNRHSKTSYTDYGMIS